MQPTPSPEATKPRPGPELTMSQPSPAATMPRPGPDEWADWRWHMRNSIRTLDALRRWIDVSPEEEAAIAACAGRFRWRVTPYYASLMDPHDPSCPVRRQAIPALGEFETKPYDEVDPVGDTYYRKTNRVVHKYPDRVIMLVTETCPVYCRHCTRKFHTTNLSGTYFGDREARSFQEDFDYIRSTPSIRDVLLTGGDPLTYGDEKLEAIVRELRSIPHVEIIRIGSRYPVLLPQRITPELCRMLERYHPVWLNTHFNHPKEITPESAAACDRLLRHGVPVGNQTVLLKGVNDDAETMRTLMKELVRIRVRPYYLYHCDNVAGVSHFGTTLEEGRAIHESLQGWMTGFAVPQYVVTTKLGKIPASREFVVPDADGARVENYEGRTMHVQHL